MVTVMDRRNLPTSDIGRPDLVWGQWGQGIQSDWYETTPDLTWPVNVQTYGRMRHDPLLTGILAAFFLPILRASWAVDPAGCRDEVAEAVCDDLGLPIIGLDADPGPARNRGVIWGEHLRIALDYLVYGHMPFELRYEVTDRAHLIHVGERMPWTVAQIHVNDDGTLQKVVQITQGEPMPAQRLLWYVRNREGSNWAGQSILRSCWAPWLLKHEAMRAGATAIRRFGMGVPVVEAPAGATPAQVQQAQQLASAMRVGDMSGVGLPNGFTFKLVGLTGTTPDARGFAEFMDQQMATSALSMMLNLGSTRYGNRALGQSFLEFYLLALKGVADAVAGTATSGHNGTPGLVTDLVTQNWGEDEPAPRIVCSDVGMQPDVLATSVSMLVTAGALIPDPSLDAYMRQALNLPESVVPAPIPGFPWPGPPAWVPPPVEPGAEGEPYSKEPGAGSPAVPNPENPPAFGVGGEPLASVLRRAAAARQRRYGAVAGSGQVRAGWKPRRKLTAVEAASGWDPEAARTALADDLAALLKGWEDVTAAQHDALTQQVEAAIDTGDIPALASLTVDSKDGAVLLRQAMKDHAQAAVKRAIGEAKSQGVTVKASQAKVDLSRLGADAKARAGLAASYMAQQAGTKSLQVAAGGLSEAAKRVGEIIRSFLAGLSRSPLEDQLSAALHAAENAGRVAVLKAAEEAGDTAVYTSTEYNDSNTCAPCKDEDGHQFGGLAEAEAAYVNGGYVGCLGGLRCRGTVIAVWGGVEPLNPLGPG